MMGMDVIFVVVWAIVSTCLMLFALLMWWVARSDCRLYELSMKRYMEKVLGRDGILENLKQS